MAANASNNVEGVRNMGIASWALCRTLQHEVTEGFDSKERYERDIRKNMPREQADQLLGSRNKLYRAQYDVHRAIDVFTDEVTNLDKRTLANNLNTVSTACCECERLYTTPIPLLYTGQTLRFLTFWVSNGPVISKFEIHACIQLLHLEKQTSVFSHCPFFFLNWKPSQLIR